MSALKLVLTLVFLVAVAGCGKSGGEMEIGKKATLEGTLRDDITAVEGETTGFDLEVVKGETMVTQEIEGDPNILKQYVGQTIRVTGEYIQKDYTQRGKVKVLQVEQIEPVRP